MFLEGGQTRKHCFLAMSPEGGQTRKYCFLDMFAEGEQTRKNFLAVFPKGRETRNIVLNKELVVNGNANSICAISFL